LQELKDKDSKNYRLDLLGSPDIKPGEVGKKEEEEVIARKRKLKR
jgi:hypothetical protein